MGCDMCGKEARLSEAIVEGTVMSVCQDCIYYGKAIEVGNRTQALKERATELAKEEMEFLHPECGIIVKKARERKELTQENLAKALAEKESLIQKIEGGFEPPIKIARKLEQFLGVKLVFKSLIKNEDSSKKEEINFKGNGLTIGDLLKIKK